VSGDVIVPQYPKTRYKSGSTGSKEFSFVIAERLTSDAGADLHQAHGAEMVRQGLYRGRLKRL